MNHSNRISSPRGTAASRIAALAILIASALPLSATIAAPIAGQVNAALQDDGQLWLGNARTDGFNAVPPGWQGDVFAQARMSGDERAERRQRMPRTHQPRPVSDQEHAWQRRESGQNLPFSELMRRAHAVGRGEYLGSEPDISSNLYRFKFMRPGGNVVWVDVDGRTGRVLAERD